MFNVDHKSKRMKTSHSKVESSAGNISDLPHEVLVEIFKYYVSTEGVRRLLDVLSHVCESWKEIAKHPGLWTVIDADIKKSVLLNLSKKGQFLWTESLNLSRIAENMTEGECDKILSKSPKLKCVDVSRCPIKCKILDKLGIYCKELESFSYQYMKNSLSNQYFTSLFLSCGAKLKCINLSNNYIKNASLLLSQIASSCPNLKEFHFMNIAGGDFGFPLAKFGEGCPNLEVLNFEGCAYNITNSKGFNGFPSLHTFTSGITNEGGPSSLGIKELLKGSIDLKNLDLRGCKIKADALMDIPAKNVHSLYLSRTIAMSDSNLPDIMLKWRHSLKIIDLSRSLNLSVLSNSLFVLTTGDLNLSLEVIDLSSTQVTKQLVMMLIKQCRNLRCLNVESCRNLDRGTKRVYHSRSEIVRMFLE